MSTPFTEMIAGMALACAGFFGGFGALRPGLRAVTEEAERAAAPHQVRARVRPSAVSHRMPHVR